MAGLSGNTAWLMAAKQASKGTAATVAANTTFKNPFAGGNIGPVRETDNLEETDSSRDRGIAYVTTSGVEGEPELYVRDGSIGFWLFAALGTSVPTGIGPNYTHTQTPANTIPYITVWKNQSDVLYERYTDCMVSSISVSAEAGQPLSATVGLQGRTPTRLTTNPDAGNLAPIDNSAVYSFNEASIQLGGGATSLISSFELTLENNVTRQQTDDVTPYDVVPGTREVSLGFDMIFENLDEYNKFHYGGAAGTTISSNIFTTSADFTFTKGANNEIKFTLPSIAYEEFPVEPDPGGDPIVVSARAVAQRGASPVLTSEIKNQIATY